MKICMIISTPFPPVEGIGYYTYNLSKKLIEKGHEVVVITRGSRNKTKRELFENIEVIKAPFIPIYPFYIHVHGIFVNRLLKSLESQIDIIHLHTPLTPNIKTSLPVITTIHSPMLADNRYIKVSSIFTLFSKISARFVSYPIEKKLIQTSKKITTVSEAVAKELEDYGLDSKEITVMYNGVNEAFFTPNKNKHNGVNKYILYVGHINREKGLFDLAECAKYICCEKSDISFIIAGKGRDLDKMKLKIKKAGIEDKFIFLGQVDQDKLIELYQNASLFIFPSYHEGLPTVLLEAMSCGLPVIATDVRGNKDLISNGENGILVPPRNPKKMAEIILKLIDDEKLIEQLGKNARKTIMEKYTWNDVSNNFLKCYESLVGADNENLYKYNIS